MHTFCGIVLLHACMPILHSSQVRWCSSCSRTGPVHVWIVMQVSPGSQHSSQCQHCVVSSTLLQQHNWLLVAMKQAFAALLNNSHCKGHLEAHAAALLNCPSHAILSPRPPPPPNLPPAGQQPDPGTQFVCLCVCAEVCAMLIVICLQSCAS